MNIHELQTPRLLARRLTTADIQPWVAYMTAPGAMRFFPGIDASRAGAEYWIERQLMRYQRDGCGLMALIERHSGVLIGQCGLLRQVVDDQPELEVGYHLLPAWRGKGYGLEAAQAFRDLAFDNEIATSVVSLIHINNHDSQRLAERNGLQRERLTLNYGTFAGVPHYIYRMSREQWLTLQQAASGQQPFVVSDDRSRLDRALIHEFLSCQSYWAQGIPESVLNQALDHSLCFGGYLGNHQVAFARVVTDCATFANLLDVFVLPQWRGRGFARCLLKAVMSHPDLQGLRRIMLATRDAHGLYKAMGFSSPQHPDSLMERYQPDIYR